MSWGLLFDATRCIGCGACSAACKEQNQLPLPIEERTTAYTWTVDEHQGGVNRDLHADVRVALQHVRVSVPHQQHQLKKEQTGDPDGRRTSKVGQHHFAHHRLAAE